MKANISAAVKLLKKTNEEEKLHVPEVFHDLIRESVMEDAASVVPYLQECADMIAKCHLAAAITHDERAQAMVIGAVHRLIALGYYMTQESLPAQQEIEKVLEGPSPKDAVTQYLQENTDAAKEAATVLKDLNLKVRRGK